MIIEIIPCLNDNYSYLIHDKQSNTVAIIDPTEFAPCDKIINKKYQKLDYILNTHHHYDHIGGNEELKKKYNSKVLGFKGDKKRISNIDKLLEDNEEFNIGNIKFITLFIPGHTTGHIAFYSKKEKAIFTGDTLFSMGCGRIFEGTYQQMFSSLNRIKDLPDDTKIYCGHEYTQKNIEFCIKYNPNNDLLKKRKTTIEEKLKNNEPSIPSTLIKEKQMNIFLRTDDPDVRNMLNLKKASNLEIFTKLRDLKDNF
jgi:hydroxyacylglutathione hydrolase